MYFPLFVGVLCLYLFCYALLCVHSSFAIILNWKRKLVALLLLSYRCIVTINVLWFLLSRFEFISLIKFPIISMISLGKRKPPAGIWHWNNVVSLLQRCLKVVCLLGWKFWSSLILFYFIFIIYGQFRVLSTRIIPTAGNRESCLRPVFRPFSNSHQYRFQILLRPVDISAFSGQTKVNQMCTEISIDPLL